MLLGCEISTQSDRHMALQLAIVEVDVDRLRVATFRDRLLPSQLLKHLELIRIRQAPYQILQRKLLPRLASVGAVFHLLDKLGNPLDQC